ncbi:MAG: hypothetical protein EOP38_09610 [Rubrivivax sp.]|nr:MAG: hypothetical protein EOP38_09610 [Rubrivivax sp.]
MNQTVTASKLDRPQKIELDTEIGGSTAQLKVQATPMGLLAAGGLLGCILLSVTALVWAATSVRRKHPIASALNLR